MKKKNQPAPVSKGQLFVEQIREQYSDEKIWCADGYEDAVLGYDEDSSKLIYSVKKAVQICISQMTVTKADLSEHEKRGGMTLQEKREELGREFFEFNVVGTKGEMGGIWCRDDFEF